MRCSWEQIGVLGPIYRLLGQGLKRRQDCRELNLTDEKVRSCINWILRLLKLKNRGELVLYASSAA